MVGKIEEINLRAVSIFTTAQLTAVPPYYSVDTSVDSVDSTMPGPCRRLQPQQLVYPQEHLAKRQAATESA